ncbi:MAG: hypothetical protein H0T71_08420 [Acidobacteria bacterium]|nr:hypothetical protein [Acidobacteriota bacterium]
MLAVLPTGLTVVWGGEAGGAGVIGVGVGVGVGDVGYEFLLPPHAAPLSASTVTNADAVFENFDHIRVAGESLTDCP